MEIRISEKLYIENMIYETAGSIVKLAYLRIVCSLLLMLIMVEDELQWA
jgi:hypothetical protein